MKKQVKYKGIWHFTDDYINIKFDEFPGLEANVFADMVFQEMCLLPVRYLIPKEQYFTFMPMPTSSRKVVRKYKTYRERSGL